MRSLPIVHTRPFAQPRLALRLLTICDGGGIFTDREKPDEKLRRIFWGKRVKAGRKITSYFLGDRPR